MEDDSRTEKFQQIVSGALGHFQAGSVIEFEGSAVTIPFRRRCPAGG